MSSGSSAGEAAPHLVTYRWLLARFWRRRFLLLALTGIAGLWVLTEGFGLGLVLLILGSGSAQSLLASGGPMSTVVTRVVVIPAEQRVPVAAAVLVLATLVRSGLQFIQSLLSLEFRRRVEREVQEESVERLYALPLSFLQQERAGGLLAVAVHYVRQTGQLALGTGQAIANAVVLGAYLVLALLLSWQLTLLSIALLGTVAVVLRLSIGRKIRQASQEARDLVRELHSLLYEHLSGMQVIRLFDRTDWGMNSSRQSVDAFLSAEFRAGAWMHLSTPLYAVLNAGVLALLMAGGSVLLPGSPGELIARLTLFLIIAFRLMGPLGHLAQFQAHLTQWAPAVQAVIRHLETVPVHTITDGEHEFTGLKSGVTLNHVTFGYSAGEPPVLQDVSLSIEVGQMVAIAGASGAGKSTITSLLTRLYDPDSGCIRVDGRDLRDLRIGSWRRRVAVVSQDVFLFHATVWDNLRFARLDAADDEVIGAASIAQAHEFIQALPNGYDTVLQERGARLSGGQRQRIALARAVLLNADLLILDEATSELDSETEQALQEALEEYRKGRTMLVVAHRLSTIRRSDVVFVLRDGQVVETGNHATLLRRGGVYASLVRGQALSGDP
ncbi:MAG: ABC transporter ATP-binding protein [Chloroflexi bacterium]|nr:ABC transporter ATP-binding protein [Chloroflexota bacterium]